ncbi:MAG: aldo/keto reductase [Pseudomonadota bacterium]
MEQRQLGRSGIAVSELCLGCMTFGTQLTKEESFHQLDRAFEAGITTYDTAEMYSVPPGPEAQGLSERILGEWINARGLRDQVVIASKVAGRSSLLPYIRKSGELPVLDEANIAEAIDASLGRLNVDVIDFYQVHWPDRKIQLFGEDLRGYVHYGPDHIPIEDTLGALQKLVDAGKIRAIGVSNESPWGIMRYLAASDQLGLPRIHGNQNAYNLLNRTWEYGLAEIALQEDVGLLSYSPLAQGYLSGKYLNGGLPEGSRKARWGDRLGRYSTPSTDDAIAAYCAVAAKFGVDPSAMALRFVTSRPWTTTAIFGVSNDAQLDVALSALSMDWGDEIEQAVNEVHARWPNPCP